MFAWPDTFEDGRPMAMMNPSQLFDRSDADNSSPISLASSNDAASVGSDSSGDDSGFCRRSSSPRVSPTSDSLSSVTDDLVVDGNLSIDDNLLLPEGGLDISNADFDLLLTEFANDPAAVGESPKVNEQSASEKTPSATRLEHQAATEPTRQWNPVKLEPVHQPQYIIRSADNIQTVATCTAQKPFPLQQSVAADLNCTTATSPHLSAVAIMKPVAKPVRFLRKKNQLLESKEVEIKPAVVMRTSAQGAVTSYTPVTSVNLNFSSRMRQPVFRSEADERAWRKEQKLMKNRQSANESRKRKREYTSNLEMKVQKLASANCRLEEENRRLREQLSQLCRKETPVQSAVVSHLPGPSKPSGPVRNVFLFSVVLTLFFNVAYFVPKVAIIERHRSPDFVPFDQLSTAGQVHFRSRSLKGLDSLELADSNNSYQLEQQGVGLNRSEIDRNDCANMVGAKSYANQSTEASRRLVNQLKTWVDDHGIALPVPQRKRDNEAGSRGHGRRNRSSRRNKSRPVNNAADFPLMGNQVLDIFNRQRLGGAYHSWSRVLDTFSRSVLSDGSNDTFYMVSLKTEYLLLTPQLVNFNLSSTDYFSRNEAGHFPFQPRMSLIVPVTFGLNGSVTLMQIDCDITNATRIHMNNTAFNMFSHYFHFQNSFKRTQLNISKGDLNLTRPDSSAKTPKHFKRDP